MRIGIVANAPMDLIVAVKNEFLAEFGFEKLVCTPIDWERAEKLEERLEKLQEDYAWSPGGCGANIAVWLKMLGIDTTMIAPFGREIFGRIARSSIMDLQIRCLGYDYNGAQSRTFTMITDDKDRTFASVAGPVPTANLDVMLEQLADHDYLLIDGYFLEHEGAPDILVRFVEEHRHFGRKIVFCPNDSSVIINYREATDTLVDLADCLLMNGVEAKALFPDTSYADIVAGLSARGKNGAITYGAEGATVFDPGAVHEIGAAIPPRDHVNTVGAGDAFSAGYIAGIFMQLGLKQRGELGRLCAAEILTTSVARPELFNVEAVRNALARARSH